MNTNMSMRMSIDNSPEGPTKNSENINYLLNVWNNIVGSNNKPPAQLYAEGGPLKADEVQGMSTKCLLKIMLRKQFLLPSCFFLVVGTVTCFIHIANSEFL